MRSLNESKYTCCGCEACVQICPMDCLEMQPDSEGFLYPEKDETKCIDCGLCERVCQYGLQVGCRKPIRAYACIHKDQTIRSSSSSGGIVTAFSRAVIQEGGTVFGVAMSSDCYSARFIECQSEEELCGIRSSKYLQSSIDGVYENVKGLLDRGKLVLFTGTPCQVNALKLFLNRDYENLLCIDVICHGVPSSMIWEKYASYLEERYKSKILNVCFRSKKQSWSGYGLNVEFRNTKKRFCLKEYEPYLQFFLKSLSLRPSCFNCKAKSVRMADISLGDFWKAGIICPDMDDGKGTSLVSVRTKKGERWFETIGNTIRSRVVNYDDAVKYNLAEVESATEPADRHSFFHDIETMNIPELAKKYVFSTAKSRMKYILYRLGVLT